VPSLAADAGMFTWVDFRSWLPLVAAKHQLPWPASGTNHHTAEEQQQKWDAEAALYDDLRKECKVVLTPGNAQHACEAGFFRICFAFVDAEALAYALDKVAAYAHDKLGL